MSSRPGESRIFDEILNFSVQIAEIPKKSSNLKIGEFWTRIAQNQQHFENKTAKMRESLMKFG